VATITKPEIATGSPHRRWPNYLSTAYSLAELYTHLTARLATISAFAVRGLDGLSIMAIVAIVINVAMLRWVFGESV
jgi:hypothetical protein